MSTDTQQSTAHGACWVAHGWETRGKWYPKTRNLPYEAQRAPLEARLRQRLAGGAEPERISAAVVGPDGDGRLDGSARGPHGARGRGRELRPLLALGRELGRGVLGLAGLLVQEPAGHSARVEDRGLRHGAGFGVSRGDTATGFTPHAPSFRAGNPIRIAVKPGAEGMIR